jgi:hypothetical protein
MDTDKCCPEDNDLRVAIACLEMEISDSILNDLLSSLSGRLEDSTNSPAAMLLLHSMNAIAHHIDTLRVKSDLEAFNLIDQLWSAYVTVTTDLSAEEGLQLAIRQNRTVLDWQHQCILSFQEKPTQVEKPASLAVNRLIKEQISETNNFVRQEIAALKSITGITASSPAQPEQVPAFMSEQIQDLQALFQQEIHKLLQEIHPDAD